MEEKLAPSTSERRSERRFPPIPMAAPWLVIPHGKGGNKDQAFFNICEPKIRSCRKCIPELTRKSYWQSPSHQGWLVILCDDGADSTPNCNFGDCFLLNPVSMETIQLPTLFDWILLDHYEIRGCALSSPPNKSNPDNNDDDDSNSMVFFVFSPKDEIHEHVLVFCRPGEDEQWRTQELPGNLIDKRCEAVRSFFCFKGKLYVMCLRNCHIEIEIQLGSNDDHQTPLSIRKFVLSADVPFFPSKGGLLIPSVTDYVESCDEIFKVVKYHTTRGAYKVVTLIQVLRLDFSLKVWNEVKSLGDHVLFLGRHATASCSAAQLGLTKGFLYYTLPEDQSLYKFDLEHNETTIQLPCVKLPTPWFSPDWIMMMPTTIRVADGRRRRRIEDMLGNEQEEDKIIIEAEENRETKKQRPSSTGMEKTTCLSPWLVFSQNNDTIYKFVDPMHNDEKHSMNLSELLVGATIRFSKGGWLLMSKGEITVFFYNPFARALIQLPDLPNNLNYDFSGISLSSLPTSSDCKVFAITLLSQDQVLIYFIARGDDSWTCGSYRNSNLPRYREFWPCLNNPVFYNGAFYCLDYNGTLGVFSIVDGFIWKALPKPQEQFNPIFPSFLVECEGKLLAVDVGHVGKSVKVFRLDFSKMAWVKFESLGKHMLFISDTSCLSAIAPHSHMENKIYFPRLHAGERILFYSLDTGRYHTLGSRHSAMDFYDTTENSNCSWIEPNWSQTTVQELDWLSI